jgi:type IV pilus assembly protein PilC
MQKFQYKAKNNRGEIVSGTVKANNQGEAEKILIKHNLVPTEMNADRGEFFSGIFVSKVSARDRAVFSRQLATMLSAGLSLTKAISILVNQARTKQIKEIFLAVYKDLEEGYSLSSALAKHPEAFDKVYISIVSSGESTGKLDIVLQELAGQLEKDSQFNSKVKSSLYYPAFIFGVLIIAGIMLLTFVVPKLRTMFDQSGKDLPIMTKVLLGMSGFMQYWWWLVIIVIIGIIMFVKFWSNTQSGARIINNFEITIPGISAIFEGLYMYRFTKIMSMLVGAGVPLLDALRIGGAVIDNVIYEESIMGISNQVERGIPLSTELLKDPYFPPLIGQMVAVGEETGELDKVLSKVADYYEESTSNITKTISSLVEPAILVIVGLSVAFIVFAIYLPIYQLNSSVG